MRDLDTKPARDDVNEETRYEVAVLWAELDALGGFGLSSDRYLGVDWAFIGANGDNERNIDRSVQ